MCGFDIPDPESPVGFHEEVVHILRTKLDRRIRNPFDRSECPKLVFPCLQHLIAMSEAVATRYRANSERTVLSKNSPSQTGHSAD